MTATIPEGWAAHSARLAEELAARRVCCHACGARVLVGETAHDAEPAARRVCCHACGARVLVGETAHDAEPADDGAERFACAEHCEVCR